MEIASHEAVARTFNFARLCAGKPWWGSVAARVWAKWRIWWIEWGEKKGTGIHRNVFERVENPSNMNGIWDNCLKIPVGSVNFPTQFFSSGGQWDYEAAKRLPMPNLGAFTLGDEAQLKVPNWSLGRAGFLKGLWNHEAWTFWTDTTRASECFPLFLSPKLAHLWFVGCICLELGRWRSLDGLGIEPFEGPEKVGITWY